MNNPINVVCVKDFIYDTIEISSCIGETIEASDCTEDTCVMHWTIKKGTKGVLTDDEWGLCITHKTPIKHEKYNSGLYRSDYKNMAEVLEHWQGDMEVSHED